MLEFIGYIYTCFNKNVSTMTIFLHFSKAFDTVNHDILVSKLACYGLRGIWFRSKAICRGWSGFRDNNIGVPQGSILLPVLFVFNDMCNSLDSLKFIYFADDTTIF